MRTTRVSWIDRIGRIAPLADVERPLTAGRSRRSGGAMPLRPRFVALVHALERLGAETDQHQIAALQGTSASAAHAASPGRSP